MEPNTDPMGQEVQPEYDPYVDHTVYVPAVPNVEEPPEDPDPEVTSVLMKISRAIGGDTYYVNRVNIALEIAGLPQSRVNLLHVTRQVAEFISCKQSGTVDTSKVTDDHIESALETAPDQGY